MTTVAELDAEIEKLEADRAALFKKKEPIDRQLTAKYNKIEKLKDQRAKLILSQPMTFEQKIEYFLNNAGDNEGMEKYRAAEKFFHEELGFFTSGYVPDTKQKNIKVMMYRDKPESLTKTLDSLNKVLPFIKQTKKGFIFVDIFEHTLSEYGCYGMRIFPDKVEISLHRHYRESTEATFTDLEAALVYIQRNHYYETGSNDDEE